MYYQPVVLLEEYRGNALDCFREVRPQKLDLSCGRVCPVEFKVAVRGLCRKAACHEENILNRHLFDKLKAAGLLPFRILLSLVSEAPDLSLYVHQRPLPERPFREDMDGVPWHKIGVVCVRAAEESFDAEALYGLIPAGGGLSFHESVVHVCIFQEAGFVLYEILEPHAPFELILARPLHIAVKIDCIFLFSRYRKDLDQVAVPELE